VVDLELESGCLTAGELVRLVKERTARVREAAPGEPALKVRVTIEGDQRVVGRLLMTGNDGAMVAREVEGATCQEVVEALALVLAVALDPLVDPRRAATASTSIEPALPSPPRRAADEARAPRASARPHGEAPYRQLVGGEVAVSAGLIERPLVALGPRYAISRESVGGRTLLFTLGAFATFAADAAANHPSGGSIRYRLQALDATGCPFGALVHPSVRLYSCVALTVGRLQAEGVNLPGHRADAALFVAAALAGRVIVDLAGPIALIGAAGLSVPLGTYPAVVVGADESVGNVQPLGIILAFGVAVRLP
jgi:hypothetical protein